MASKILRLPPAIAPGALVTEALHSGLYLASSDLVGITGTPVSIFSVPANTIVYDVFAEIVAVYDGTTPGIDVGVAGATARHLPSADITEGTLGFYGNAKISPFKYTSAATIIVTLTLSGATVGSSRFYCLFRPLSNMNEMVANP